ncbi:methyl-accepting chemotaxis protein, partial [Thermococcus sp.]|uniref:PDC sensor domain-containing protein n=1 Tax=Thermococcus sp. TaxID=35749 RepID=UPI00261B3620
MNFKTKMVGIVVVALLLVTVLAGAMMLYTGNHVGKVLEDKLAPEIDQQAREMTLAEAQALANQFSGFFKEVEVLGTATQLMVTKSLDEMQEEGVNFGDPGYADRLRPLLLGHFATVSKAEPLLSAVYFGDVNGNMYIYPKQELPQGYDPRKRPWYQEAVAKNGPAWSQPYKDASSGKWVITYAVPVYYNGKFVGVIGLDVYIDTLAQEVKKVKIGKTGYAYVIGPDGMTILHPNEEYEMKVNVFNEPALKPIAEIVKSGKDQATVVYTWNGVRSVSAGVKIPETGWYVFAKVPVNEISAGIIQAVDETKRATWKSTILLTITGFIVSAVLVGISYKLVSSSLKPLERLSKVAQALAEGRLSEVNKYLREIHYLEDDEIGALIKAFEAVGKDLVGTLNTIATKLERLAEGDLSNGLSMEAKGELKEILEDLRNTTHKLKNLIGEIVKVTDTLEERANVLAKIASDVTEAINQVNEAVQQVSIEAQRQQEHINEITEG